MTGKSMLNSAIAATLVALSVAAEANAQTVPSPDNRSVTVAPGPEYSAGWLKEKLLGPGWRDVWVTPVDAPVFDIGSYAGGLKPVNKGGGNQTLSLHMVERAGWREYIFRSVNKYPVGQAMPPEIQGTTLGYIIQDQVSSLFPAGALVIPPLLRAVGVLQVTPELYIMPDDPRLGEFREMFAGMLGTVELSPQEAPNGEPGFAGSRKIAGGDAFLKDVDSTRDHRLDERELFAVRLIDFLVNDNDRTADNIRFVRFGTEDAWDWRPLPRDRDRVFVDAGGWINKFVVRPVYPKLIAFGPDYDLAGLTFESHNLDRRLLQRITRDDADSIALRVQRAIDNGVIDEVVAAMPSNWRRQTGADEHLRITLRARRDNLPDFAHEFYEWLSTEVDVHGTDEKEIAIVDRHPDGRVTVTVKGPKASESSEPFSRRTFLPSETNEVRVYLDGDDDQAVVRGAANDAITVRIIGGGGDDVMTDSAGGGGTRFYDSKGNKNRFITRGTRVSEREWDVPKQGAGVRFDAPWRPDWGKSNGWGPLIDYADGAGPIVGFGPRYQSYGFRRLPHKWKASANLMVGLANLRPGVNMNADYRFENSPLIFDFAARATRFESFRFHGFGNDVPRVSRRLALVDQDVISVEPRLVWQIGWRSREEIDAGLGSKDSVPRGLRPLIGKLYAGPVFYWNKGDPEPTSPFAFSAGDDGVSRAGVRLGLELDQTSKGPVSDRGWTFETALAGYPPFLDIDEALTTATAVGAAYLPFGGRGMHVGVRAGGATASGSLPVYHAPYIGGRSSVRGYASHRYTGDRSAFGSAELRVPTDLQVPLLVRWRVGVFGLADVGRVWFDGESPGGWHAGYGGGLWFSSLGQAFSVAFAHGEENRFYLQRGLSF